MVLGYLINQTPCNCGGANAPPNCSANRRPSEFISQSEPAYVIGRQSIAERLRTSGRAFGATSGTAPQLSHVLLNISTLLSWDIIVQIQIVAQVKLFKIAYNL